MPSKIFSITDQDLGMTEAQTIAAQDHPLIEISSDLTLGPFEKGHEYRMARWIAEKLRSESILDIRDPSPATTTEVSKILWREVRSNIATKLPDSFYPRFRSYLRLLRDQAAKTGKPATLREEEQARQKLRDLVDSRLQKILRLALAINVPVAALEGLTPEERELYGQVREKIDSWTQELQAI